MRRLQKDNEGLNEREKKTKSRAQVAKSEDFTQTMNSSTTLYKKNSKMQHSAM